MYELVYCCNGHEKPIYISTILLDVQLRMQRHIRSIGAGSVEIRERKKA
ncbi:MAG: hypothetical protein AB7D57_07135 [Desulfovibrionaceae bacterium]